MRRKGLGKGLGKGYKNLVLKDPVVHSLSARGIKSYNQIPTLMAKKTLPPKRIRDFVADHDFVVSPEDVMELEKASGSEVEDLDDYYSDYIGKREGWHKIEMEDGTEWVVAPSEDEAEEIAVEMVAEQLEESPELFTQSWLQGFMKIYDTDRRMIAQEESDHIVDDLKEDDILEEADKQDEYDELQEQIDEEEENDEPDEEKIESLEDEQEELIEDAREQLREEKYDEIYDALEDPVEYFVEEQGMYSREDLLKQPFISIDIDKASQSAVDVDGWAHFLCRYDGGSSLTYLDDEKVAWRDN